MPGKPGRSGRPRRDPPPPPCDAGDSNNEQVDDDLPCQQPATAAVLNPKKRQRSQPKRCKLAEHDDVSTTNLVESDSESGLQSTISDQSSQSDMKLRPKTSTENLKDRIIGAPVDRFNTHLSYQ